MFGPPSIMQFSVLSSFAIIYLRKRYLVALLSVLAVVWLLVFCFLYSML